MKYMLQDLLCMSQYELAKAVMSVIPKGWSVYYKPNAYIYCYDKSVKFENTPLLLSHLDTVDEDNQLEYSHIINNNGVLSVDTTKSKKHCLGGDDRCGVYIMLSIMFSNPTDYRFLFTFDEEIGGLGGDKFVKDCILSDKYVTALVSLDRRSPNGGNQIAHYGYDNTDLSNIFLNKGYEYANGSFTDCVTISDRYEIACVNLSVGYDHEHCSDEVIHMKGMYHTIDTLQDLEVIKLLCSKLYGCEVTPYDYRNDYDDYYYNNKFYSELSSIYKEVVCDVCGTHDLLYVVSDTNYCGNCLIDEMT